MSEGRVWHRGCKGELVYHYGVGFTCTECKHIWDGREIGVAEWRFERARRNDGD